MKIALSNCEGFIVTKCNIVCINFGDDFQQKYFVERSCVSFGTFCRHGAKDRRGSGNSVEPSVRAL